MTDATAPKKPAKPRRSKTKRRPPGLTREQAEELYARLADDRPAPRPS
jgi:endonuclease-3